jgi:tRNA-2-methylthio-N6-dimethylallyladenosine synthase
MKRLYTVEYYRDMLLRCREKVPGVAISSDFIVGFCGETEESFEKTMELVREAKFKNSFIFKYSPRPGTKADDLLTDDIAEEVKKRRNNDLLAIQNANSLSDHRSLIGCRAEILVEGFSKHGERQPTSGPRQLTGRTLTDHIVVCDGDVRLIGQIVPVVVKEATSFTLYGEVETDEWANEAIAGFGQSDSNPSSSSTIEANRRRTLPLI